MTDTPAPPQDGDHAWIHDNLAAYLAGGLESAERQRFDDHINACPDCFDAFTEARDADRHLQRTLGTLAPENFTAFEDRLTTRLREKTMTHTRRLFIRRASYASAACLALAATGVFANFAIHQNGRFNNPLSRELVARADTADRDLAMPVEQLMSMVKGRNPNVASAASTPNTMAFRFVNTPMSNIIDKMSQSFDMKIVTPEHPSFTSVTVDVDKPLNADEAVSTLRTLLAPMSYQAIEASDTNSGKTVLHIVSRSEAKKTNIPVYEGGDASKIPATDQIVTAVIPLQHIPAVQLRNDLGPLLSKDADVTTNGGSTSIVVTDTGTKVKRLTEIISKMDQQQAGPYLSMGRQSTGPAGDGGSAGGAASGFGGGGGGRGGGGGAGAPTFAVRQSVASAEGLIPYADQMAQAADQRNAVGGKDDVGVEFGATSLKVGKDGLESATFDSGKLPAGSIGPALTSRHDLGTKGIQAGPVGMYEGDPALFSTNGGAANGPGKFSIGAGVSTNSGPIGSISHGITSTGGALDTAHDANVSVVEFGNLNTFNQAVPQQTGVPGSIAGAINGSQTTAGTNGYTGSTTVTGGGFYYQDSTKALSASNKPEESIARIQGREVEAKAKDVSGAQKEYDDHAMARAVRVSKASDGPVSENGALPSSVMARSSELKDENGPQDPERPRAAQLLSDKKITGSSSAIPIAAASPPATRPVVNDSAPRTASAANLKIIRNGNLDFEVRSFDDTATTVTAIVGEEGGFVSSTSSEKLANGKVRGSIIVRVPPEHLDIFVAKLRALGELKGQQINAQDVTKVYYDTDSELRGLRTMEGRLLDLIKNGKGEVKDLIEAEAKLGETRIQMEKLEGDLRYYNNLVGMATLTINAYEKDIQTPTAATEMENVNVSVETEEVEAKYQSARKILADAKARIVESQLKNTDADHIAATITADVPPEQADFVAAQLKQLGKVASFTRDRRQTTAGGEGAPAPRVQVEQKDTRFSIALYNLANFAPRETTVLTVAVRNVETSYKDILAIIRKEAPAGNAAEGAAPRAMGRVINTTLNGQVPEQMTADLRAELRTDGTGTGATGATGGADAVLQAIRDSGEVIASSLSVNPDTTNSTAAKRGIQLRLVNIAAVPPKESETIVIAVRDVEASYKKTLALLAKPVEAAPGVAPNPAAPRAPAGQKAEPEPTGRILFNTMSGQQPEQMTADIRAEVRADQANAVLQALRDTGETLSSSSAQNPDPINVTRSKEGLQLRFVNVIAVPARETQHLRLVAADVSGSYNKLLAALQAIAATGEGHIFSSSLNQSDPRTVSAALAFEASRKSQDDIDKAFAAAGIDLLSRTINRSSNTTNTLDGKVAYLIDELKSADSLDPNRTFTLTVEVDNVDRAMAALRSVETDPVKEIDFSSSAKESKDRMTGHIVLDSPTAKTASILAAVRDLGGIERDNQVAKNLQVPDTRFSKDRIDLTLISRPTIVQSDQGLWLTVRAALSSASGALIYSLYLVLTGLMFIAPFALIIWPLWKLMKRRKATA